MIVLDTNVISEPHRRNPDPRVLSWLGQHAQSSLLTAVTIAELEYGAARLPRGGRREALTDAVRRLADEAGDRLLPFDRRAAAAYAGLRAEREARGRAVTVEAAMIAAICLAGGHALATRNTRDFEGLGLQLIDPWK